VHILFLAISADYWTKLEKKGSYGKKVPGKILGIARKNGRKKGMGKCVNCVCSLLKK
jgi:hypothetical protein